VFENKRLQRKIAIVNVYRIFTPGLACAYLVALYTMTIHPFFQDRTVKFFDLVKITFESAVAASSKKNDCVTFVVKVIDPSVTISHKFGTQPR